MKRHILTDAHGVPLAAIITGANVFDGKMLEATLDAAVLRGPRGPRRPQHLCLDKAYDSRATRRAKVPFTVAGVLAPVGRRR